jgi:hypothetical protein
MGTTPKTRKIGIFAVTALPALALLAAPAFSEMIDKDSKVVVDPDTLPQNRELDRRYHEILNRQPDGKDAHDPWGTVRASETKPKPKDDKKHSTTGTAGTK